MKLYYSSIFVIVLVLTVTTFSLETESNNEVDTPGNDLPETREREKLTIDNFRTKGEKARESGSVAQSCTKGLGRMKMVFTFEQENNLTLNKLRTTTFERNNIPHTFNKAKKMARNECPGVSDDVFEISEKANTGRKKHENMGETTENAATLDPSGSKTRENKISVQSPQTPVQGEAPVDLLSVLPKRYFASARPKTEDGTLQRTKLAQGKDHYIQAMNKILATEPYEDYFVKHGILYKYKDGKKLIVVPPSMQNDTLKKSLLPGTWQLYKPGDDVVVQNLHDKTWFPAKVVCAAGPRSFTVQKESGDMLRRNTFHLRHSLNKCNVSPDFSDTGNEVPKEKENVIFEENLEGNTGQELSGDSRMQQLPFLTLYTQFLILKPKPLHLHRSHSPDSRAEPHPEVGGHPYTRRLHILAARDWPTRRPPQIETIHTRRC
ncbi:hypothetical protein ILUMI_25747 [Ignelater luminosus]|uniref:Uncharacterized protein n=1 Tax=Ignelater luminosus TaxID=2038154 RepID=A0A8K0C9B7_IGNLU|nr:hypothetical protein ILUMI_25747 [Ignelater luminosus]